MSLTFNVEVNKISHYPVQICSTPFIKDLSYRGDAHKDSIWHTFYNIRLFNDMSSQAYIKNYNTFQIYVMNAKKIGFGHVLIHGPSTYHEFEYTLGPLNVLYKYYKDILVIETPCFTKEVHDKRRGNMTPLDYMMSYIQGILDIGFTLDNICIDTAHLWSNGLSTNDMITLYKKYPSKYVHLNGNIRDQYMTDVHTFWWSGDNKITNGDELIKLFVESNARCIIECTTPELLWNSMPMIKSFADQYGFKLLSQD